MFRRTRLENLTGATGLAGVLSGLLTLTMMTGLILALVVTSDPDLRPAQTASAQKDNAVSTPSEMPDGSAATGASTGEAGSE